MRSIRDQEEGSYGVVLFCDNSTTARRNWPLTLDEELQEELLLFESGGVSLILMKFLLCWRKSALTRTL